MNKIYVVGIGPGAYEKMTIEAAEALKASDTIIGYTVYVDLVKDHFADKTVSDHSHDQRGGPLRAGL